VQQQVEQSLSLDLVLTAGGGNLSAGQRQVRKKKNRRQLNIVAGNTTGDMRCGPLVARLCRDTFFF